MRQARLGFRNVSVIVAILMFLTACGQVGVDDPEGPVEQDPITEERPNPDEPAENPAEDDSETGGDEADGDEPDGSEGDGSEGDGGDGDASDPDPPDDGEAKTSIDWVEAVVGYDDALEILKSSDSETVREAEDDIVVSAFGRDIWHDADEFYYVYTTLSGNGSLEAQVAELDPAHDWSKAGIMIREDLRPDARNVLLHLSGANGSVLQAREAVGALTNNDGGHDPEPRAPHWLRLTRDGDRIIGELSDDGTEWRTLGSYTMPFSGDVHIGLAVTAHAEGSVATGRFANVRLIERPVEDAPGDTAPPPAKWVCPEEPLSPAYEPTHFVSTDGNDGNDGRDPSRAFRTLSRAANAVSPGDVVWVREGVYSSDVRIHRSGSADAPIVFESYPGECAVLDGEAYGLDYGQHVQFDNVRHVTFRNFVIRNSPSQGIHLRSSHDNRISNVRVHDSGMSGIQNVRGDRNRFTRFITHHNYDPQNGGDHADGIGMSSGRDNRIDHCVSYRNSDDGIDAWRSVGTVIERCASFENGFQGGDGNGFKLGGDNVDNRTVVRHSVSFGNRMQGFNYNSGVNVTLEHNTSFDNHYYGFIAADAYLRNNLAWDDHRRDWQDDGRNEQTTNSWNLGTGDPRFISTDPTSGSFLALPSASSAVDTGTSIGLPYVGDAPDLGAIPVGQTLADVIGVQLADVLAY